MKHRYTWNHLLLLAKICGQADTEDSVTASWVKTTEEHNQLTFPFTLWPLTYRTCEVTTSPAMCSPLYLSTSDLLCDYTVKMIRCNEVVIICIQSSSSSSSSKVCNRPCRAEIHDDANGPGDHDKNHDCLSSSALLPCHTAHCFHLIKHRIKDAFYAMQEEDTKSVICVGHGSAAGMASCLASDMSTTYEAERDFLGLEKKRVSVDFVGFSDKVLASPAYWNEHSSYIDNFITVVFEDGTAVNDKSTLMTHNPRCSRLTIDKSSLLLQRSNTSVSRSISLFRMRGKQKKDVDPEHADRHLSQYILALKKKIYVPNER